MVHVKRNTGEGNQMVFCAVKSFAVLYLRLAKKKKRKWPLESVFSFSCWKQLCRYIFKIVIDVDNAIKIEV
jgi:hypothetical protein